MKNLFVSKGIYSTNDQLNYIMNAPSSEHAALWETIVAKAKAGTEQVQLSSAEYLKEYDDQIIMLGNASVGTIIKDIINTNNGG